MEIQRGNVGFRGVNLGGWLVLERWMTPSVFAGSDAVDEYQLCNDLGAEAAASRLKRHRDTFITWDDLRWIQQQGLNAVRLPIPHWLFGGFDPFIPCVQYVDWLVDASEKLGLHVLLDLHTAPGSQNGWDHSGQSGAIGWDQPENQRYFMAVIQAVAARYMAKPNVIGLELMNEPHPGIPLSKLNDFYNKTCTALKTQGVDGSQVYISDSYRPMLTRGQSCVRRHGMPIDMHLYQVFDAADKALDFDSHIQKTRTDWVQLIDTLQQKAPVIIGEWSIRLTDDTFNGMDQAAKNAALREYGAAQIQAFDAAQGWFYWSYKTEDSPEWSYRTAIERGWL